MLATTIYAGEARFAYTIPGYGLTTELRAIRPCTLSLTRMSRNFPWTTGSKALWQRSGASARSRAAGPGRKQRAFLHLERLEPRLTPTVINVNVAANVHAISPDIYGSAFASTAQLADLGLTVNRDGGNSSDTYNWLADATNHASD